MKKISCALKFAMLVYFIFHTVGCEEVVPQTEAEFTITINNLSSGQQQTILSPGVYYTHESGFPLFFKSSLDYGLGLELLAEDGIPDTLLQNLEKNKYVDVLGRFGELEAGENVSFSFTAKYGDFFNFATMFTNSNDAFYSFDEEGVLLFNADGSPFEGDITAKVWLWDAGTEVNRRPFSGEGQPTSPNSVIGEGMSTREAVRLLNDEFIELYPPREQVIQVLISAKII